MKHVEAAARDFIGIFHRLQLPYALIASRPRDLGDIDDVRFMHGALDEAYLRAWAAELGMAQELEKLLANPPI